MAVSLAELEDELAAARAPTSEFEHEYEYESELEGESEAEACFGRLAGLARSGVRSPGLRAAARAGVRAALGPRTGPTLRRGLAGRGLAEGELEDEAELEIEGYSPVRRVYPQALMEHFGHLAATTESEAEAEAFIGALVPLAARVAPAVLRVAPQLVRSAARVARTLRRSPATRPLVRTLPTIVRRTATDLARQAARGRAPTPRVALRTLARNTARVIGSPQECVRVYRRSRALDRSLHRAAPATAQPLSSATPGSGCGCAAT